MVLQGRINSESLGSTSLASLSSMDVGIANPLDSIALDGTIGPNALEGLEYYL